MAEQTLKQKLEYFGVTLNEPDGGYRSMLLSACAEINRLEGLQLPVTCQHCKMVIERADDWYRCADCGGHYHKGCIAMHARDWKPSHSAEGEPGDINAARLDVAWYDGARHAMAAIGGGMEVNDLSRQVEARTAPAKKLLAENRRSQASGGTDGG